MASSRRMPSATTWNSTATKRARPCRRNSISCASRWKRLTRRTGVSQISSRRSQRACRTTSARSQSRAELASTKSLKKFKAEHDDYNAIMAEALADRLAEAFAEYLHKRAREEWGFGAGENLTTEAVNRGELSRHSPGGRLSRVPRSHGERDALAIARRGEKDGHQTHESHSPCGRAAA